VADESPQPGCRRMANAEPRLGLSIVHRTHRPQRRPPLVFVGLLAKATLPILGQDAERGVRRWSWITGGRW
jgi:hypothetical protein